MTSYFKRAIVTGAIVGALAAAPILAVKAQDNSDSDQLSKLTTSSDWPYIRSALIFANSLEGEPQRVQWENKTSGYSGDVILTDPEPDADGCRQFRITGVGYITDVEFCKNGTVRAEGIQDDDSSEEKHEKSTRLCLSGICLGQNLQDIHVQWVDKTSEREQIQNAVNNVKDTLQGTPYWGIYASEFSDASKAKWTFQYFPAANAESREQIQKYGFSNASTSPDGDINDPTHFLDSLSYPAFVKIDAICHPIELKGEFDSDSNHRTAVYLLPEADGNHKDHWAVYRVVTFFPNIRHDSPEAAALRKQFHDRFGGISGGRAHLVPTTFQDSNGESNEGFGLALTKSSAKDINVYTRDKLTKSLDALNRQPFCHPAGNPNIE